MDLKIHSIGCYFYAFAMRVLRMPERSDGNPMRVLRMPERSDGNPLTIL